MKRIIVAISLFVASQGALAQNTFPSSGNVGIGTTSPSGILHIHSSSPNVYLTTNDYAALRGNGGTWLFGYGGASGSEDISIGTQDNTGNRTLTLAAGGKAQLKLLGNGNVGIGTTSPDSKLHVAGDGAVIKLQDTENEDTENAFHRWIGGYDKSGDEI
ncbi:MAG: hypothetical protein ABJH72_01565 [Reichenbachiella sp.]|uniref:hypothetical protein n=1 Tax=Reichenbachiella sp. TaxID=2184521 RepID=UPI0032641A42